MILNMWVRFCLSFLVASILLWAQTQMNVEQLADFVRSELALKQHSDKQIAAGVRGIQLSEKLTDKTIIDLQAQGAGQKTVEALKALRDQTANMKPPTHDVTASPETTPDQQGEGTSLTPKAPPAPPPSEAKQHEILESIRQYALTYTKGLPNFFCVEVTRQFVDPNGGQSYRSSGTILAKVGYNEGQEHYNVYSVNGKLTETTMDDVKSGGATSTGEFYSLMKTIFDPVSEPEFHWDHWAKLRDRRMAIFNYFIDSGHSIWYLEDKNSGQRIKTAYKGLIYGDPETGEIDRISFEAVDIPKSFPISQTSEILDYDLVAISGQKFMLPLSAKLWMKGGRESSKNEIEFRMYRKYEADSFIKYNLDPNAPEPLPESKTQETPGASDQAKPAETSKPAEQTPAQQPKKPNPFILPTTADLPPPPPK